MAELHRDCWIVYLGYGGSIGASLDSIIGVIIGNEDAVQDWADKHQYLLPSGARFFYDRYSILDGRDFPTIPTSFS